MRWRKSGTDNPIPGVYQTGLGNIYVKISCKEAKVALMLERLSLPPPPDCTVCCHMEIAEGSVFVDGERQGTFRDDLPRNFLEALTKVLAKNQRQLLLLHASAVLSPAGKLYIFPGSSGSGKTTLSVGLALRGWRLLTDEIVTISETYKANGYLRPVHLRADSLPILPLSEAQKTDAIQTQEGAILQIQDPGKDIFLSDDRGTYIIFPQYSKSKDFCAAPMSYAKTLLHLMSMNINGRNFSDHGFRRLAKWVRNIEGAVALSYPNWAAAADYLQDLGG